MSTGIVKQLATESEAFLALQADRDRLAAEVEALRQFAEHVRAHGDTRLASMAIAVLNAAKKEGK